MYASKEEIQAIRGEALAQKAPVFAALCDQALAGNQHALIHVTAGIEALEWPWISELEASK